MVPFPAGPTNFIFSKASKLPLGLTQPLSIRVTQAHSPGVKQLVVSRLHTPIYCLGNNGCCYASTPHILLLRALGLLYPHTLLSSGTYTYIQNYNWSRNHGNR